MTDTMLQIGAPAPDFHLKAIGSGREFSPTTHAGTPTLLVFHDQNTVDKVQEMQETARSRYGDAGQLLMASIVNMSTVPVFLRPLAQQVMQSQYAKAEAAMPEGMNAADYVIILTDWDGKVSKAYSAHKVDKQPLLVLIDGQGILRGSYRGRELAAAAVDLLGSSSGAVSEAQAPPAA